MAGMKLLVDVGNSRVKWAFGGATGFVAVGEAPHGGGAWLAALRDVGRTPDEIRLANVAGAETGARLAAALNEHFGVVPLLALSAANGAGVRSGYTDPAQLGVDRWLAICAAFARYRAPVCVVDAGTATTVDVVTGEGQHEGGLILPGIALMQSALLGHTGDLARLAAEGDPGDQGAVPDGTAGGPGDRVVALGRNTAAAIRAAAVQATACLVSACLSRLREGSLAGTAPALLLVTGGAAAPLGAAVLRMAGTAGNGAAPGLRLEHRPHLVLEGLALDPPCFRVAG